MERIRRIKKHKILSLHSTRHFANAISTVAYISLFPIFILLELLILSTTKTSSFNINNIMSFV
jgi:hypothetical protein